MPSVVTANDLRSGAVVYLTREGAWCGHLARAAVACDADGLKALEALALASIEGNEVTAVYAFEVRIARGQPEPVSVRERIRAAQSASA